MDIRKLSEEIQDDLVRIRRHVHMNPELGFEEYETSAFIKEELKKVGLTHKTWAKTGITTDIKGELGEGKTLLIRADIDALPLQEDNDVPYKSKNDGKMHACGHDTHVACVLGVANILNKNKDKFKGKVRLIFQPAEEGPGGATPMIEEGAIGDKENPEVDAAIALHIIAGEKEIEVGNIGVKDGALTAAADEVSIHVTGKGGHGSAPHGAIDPIYISAQIIVAIQGFLSRTVDPTDPVVFTVGKIVAGDRQNIISEKATMHGTLRTLDLDLRKRLYKGITNVAEKTAEIYGGKAETNILPGYTVGYNDRNLNKYIKKAFEKYYDTKNIISAEKPTMGAEDFFEFGLEGKIPTAMFWLGGGNEEKGFVTHNHSNYFDIDEDSLAIGTTVLAESALMYLSDN